MEKNDVIESWVKNLILTVIGGLIIAFIIGEGSMFQGKSLIDRANNMQATIAARQKNCTFEVQNSLLVPIQVSVDDVYIGTVDPSSTLRFEGSYKSKTFSYTSATPYAGGKNISGLFTAPISNDVVYSVGNRLDDTYYYLVEITNKSDFTCDVYIDKGYVSEAYIGKITANQEGFKSGYFQVFNNSNVVAICPDDQFYYMGEYGDKEVKYRVADYVEQDTGLFRWTMRAP